MSVVDEVFVVLVAAGMCAWTYGMFWFFGTGGDSRWCPHSVRRECARCRWLRTREGEPPFPT